MPKLVIVVNVSAVDPKATDPHDLAHDIIAEYDEYAQRNGEPPVEFVSAEWKDE